MERVRSCLRPWPEPSAGVLEGLVKVAGGHAEAGDESEEESRSDGDEERPCEGGPVNMQGAEERQGDRSLMSEP